MSNQFVDFVVQNFRRRDERRKDRRNIFGERKYFFAEEVKNREGKGGKYLEEKNIFPCRGEEKRNRNWRKNLEKKKYFFRGEEKRRRKRRKIFGEANICLQRRRKTENEN